MWAANDLRAWLTASRNRTTRSPPSLRRASTEFRGTGRQWFAILTSLLLLSGVLYAFAALLLSI